ncbi:MAG: hypothetical protein JEZ03_13910 [Bacteroidales bacterium]|nr:hypothetical protein [Bacteroidales bacterium]
MKFISNEFMMYANHFPHRMHIRLKGYDYSKAGLYFLTKGVQNRMCLFGDIINGEMLLNDTGLMVDKWFVEL